MKDWRYISLSVIFLIHATFLAAIFWEHGEIEDYVIASICSPGIILFYRSLLFEKTVHLPADYLALVTVPAGAISTYLLSIESALGPVIAAGIVGVAASFLPSLGERFKSFPAQIYCGAFVGMTSSQVINDPWLIIFAGLLSAGIFLIIRNHLNGYGGKIGSIAFGGVVITVIIHSIL